MTTPRTLTDRERSVIERRMNNRDRSVRSPEQMRIALEAFSWVEACHKVEDGLGWFFYILHVGGHWERFELSALLLEYDDEDR